jgi:RNA polymerase sigma-70 factor (ECF subfamily)
MMADEENEDLLVALVQCGDVRAFERLLVRLHQPLRSYITRLVGESLAEDVLQEISFKIYRQIGHLREPRAFRPRVYRIATRIAFVHLKRERRRQAFETDPEFTNAASAFTLQEQPDLDSGFLDLIDRLSPARRAVLLLHYQQQLSLEETAAILDIPLGTVKSRLSYGVATLRKSVKEKEKR